MWLVYFPGKLWSAPEILRKGFRALSTDQIQRADIYSTGIIINEIFCRMGTFPLSEENAYMTPGGKENYVYLINVQYYIIKVNQCIAYFITIAIVENIYLSLELVIF